MFNHQREEYFSSNYGVCVPLLWNPRYYKEWISYTLHVSSLPAQPDLLTTNQARTPNAHSPQYPTPLTLHINTQTQTHTHTHSHCTPHATRTHRATPTLTPPCTHRATRTLNATLHTPRHMHPPRNTHPPRQTLPPRHTHPPTTPHAHTTPYALTMPHAVTKRDGTKR